MKNTTRRMARLGVAGVAIVAASTLAAPSASALSFSDIASKATNVTTIVSKDTGHGTIQLRKGTYDKKTWIWARLSSPDSKFNKGWNVGLYVKKSPAYPCGTGVGGSFQDIDGTTYTSATLLNRSCLYYAYANERSPGSGFYTTATYMP